MAGGDGIAGTGGTSTVPSSAPVVAVGNSADGAAGGATVVSTVDVWTELVSDVSDVVELVVVSFFGLVAAARRQQRCDRDAGGQSEQG